MSDQQDQGSEAKVEGQPAKKKGKLPVLIALVVVLGAGGFFGFKMRSGSAKAEPKIALGEIVPLTEFLVNLQDGDVYLRTEVALHLREGFKKEGLDQNMPAVRDAIVLLLSSKTLSQVGTIQGKEQLKKDIATAVNKLLEPAQTGAKDGAGQDSGTTGGQPEHPVAEKKPPTGSPQPGAAKPGAQPASHASSAHPEWQSQTGPVLKVYFTSFATQ